MNIKIKSKNHLEALLNFYHIPLEDWGKNATKTLDNLYEEIYKGETYIETIINYDVEPWRAELSKKTMVARIFILFEDRDTQFFLRESHQLFRDGSVRIRNLLSSISEKIEASEKPHEAAIRGIKEELGVNIKSHLQLIETTGVEEKIYSTSYPGLRTEKVFFDFFVSFPTELFNSHGYKEEQKEKTTFFVWEEIT